MLSAQIENCLDSLSARFRLASASSVARKHLGPDPARHVLSVVAVLAKAEAGPVPPSVFWSLFRWLGPVVVSGISLSGSTHSTVCDPRVPAFPLSVATHTASRLQACVLVST